MKRLSGEKYCGSHLHEHKRVHGDLFGPIPIDKLKMFLNKEIRTTAQAASVDVSGAERKENEGTLKKRGGAARGLWYTRHVMWLKARKYGVDNLADLLPGQYDACLQEVHDQFRMNLGMTKKGKVVKVEKGRGPQNNGDRTRVGEETQDHMECYNGVSGGQVYRNYKYDTFKRLLKNLGVDDPLACTERQCEDALQATNLELNRNPLQSRTLEAYAGPQCFPQLKERLFANANARGDPDGDRLSLIHISEPTRPY